MLRFVTGNEGKVREARAYLDAPVSQFDVDYTEVQSDDLATIAARGAREAYAHAAEPVIVDDAGLFIDALAGFPGPYSAFVEGTLGIERVYELATREDDHSAAFRTVIAYCDGSDFETPPERVDHGADEHARYEGVDAPVALFEGRVDGDIVAPRGDGGFGYDPIFEHEGKTLAEMTTAEKNAISHRGRALESFASWFEA
jgi:XTP/dITP diphosphohydrolase